MGYDDQTFAPYLAPPLTSVRQPKAELGARAVELAIGLLREGRGRRPPARQVLPVELVVRDSFRPARNA